jgi:hypothetical protein
MAWTFYNSSGEAMFIDGGLSEIVEDTSPQLGANLDMNDFGLAFPATQSADAGANVLDDYEEGDFTPVLWDSTRSNSESQSYTIQTASYVKVGRVVHISLRLRTDSIGSLTTGDACWIGGLPFTSRAGRNMTLAGGGSEGLDITAGHNVDGQVGGSVDYIVMNNWDLASGSSGLTIAEWSANGAIMLGGHYFI